MPEAPKQGFLKGLFGGGPRPLDREELFGEASGKASTSLAKSVPGAASLAALQVSGRTVYRTDYCAALFDLRTVRYISSTVIISE